MKNRVTRHDDGRRQEEQRCCIRWSCCVVVVGVECVYCVVCRQLCQCECLIIPVYRVRSLSLSWSSVQHQQLPSLGELSSKVTRSQFDSLAKRSIIHACAASWEESGTHGAITDHTLHSHTLKCAWNALLLYTHTHEPSHTHMKCIPRCIDRSILTNTCSVQSSGLFYWHS